MYPITESKHGNFAIRHGQPYCVSHQGGMARNVPFGEDENVDQHKVRESLLCTDDPDAPKKSEFSPSNGEHTGGQLIHTTCTPVCCRDFSNVILGHSSLLVNCA